MSAWCFLLLLIQRLGCSGCSALSYLDGALLALCVFLEGPPNSSRSFFTLTSFSPITPNRYVLKDIK